MALNRIVGFFLQAYVGENEYANTDVYLSPWLASDEQLRALPKIFMIAATYDPLLDDAVCSTCFSFSLLFGAVSCMHTAGSVDSTPDHPQRLKSFAPQVDFARKLKRLGHPVEFAVAPGVPHGMYRNGGTAPTCPSYHRFHLRLPKPPSFGQTRRNDTISSTAANPLCRESRVSELHPLVWERA